MHAIRFATGVERDLRRLKAYDPGRILDAIEMSNCPIRRRFRADTRKLLIDLVPPWIAAAAESGSWRRQPIEVFYDVAPEDGVGYVRAIRRKRAGKRTDDILVKTVTVRDLQKRVKACVDDAQRDRVIVTRPGKPAAVLVGVQGEDWDAVVVQTDPKFWRLIRARRRQPTLSLGQLKRRIGMER